MSAANQLNETLMDRFGDAEGAFYFESQVIAGEIGAGIFDVPSEPCEVFRRGSRFRVTVDRVTSAPYSFDAVAAVEVYAYFTRCTGEPFRNK